MANDKTEWILRIGTAAMFLANGLIALTHNEEFVGILQGITHVSDTIAGILLTMIGVLDILIAIIVLVRPVRIALVWAAFWVTITTLAAIVVGGVSFDTLESITHISVPLALLLLRGWPKSNEWLH